MAEKLNRNELHLLANYQELMLPHEKLVARWATEEWQDDDKLPKWLRNRIWNIVTSRVLDDPAALCREICIRLLHEHRADISLPKPTTD